MKINIAQNLKGLTDSEKLAKFQTNITKCTGNADVPTPNPTLATCQTDHDAAQTLVNLVATKKAELTSLILQKDEAVALAMTDRATLAAYVENKITDPAKVPNTGFDLASAPSATPTMTKVENNVVTCGDNAGEADGGWDSKAGAKAYKVQITHNPTTGPWTDYDTVTASHIHITGQTSGQRIWTRVAAVNSKGTGPWSDEASCMVP